MLSKYISYIPPELTFCTVPDEEYIEPTYDSVLRSRHDSLSLRHHAKGQASVIASPRTSLHSQITRSERCFVTVVNNNNTRIAVLTKSYDEKSTLIYEIVDTENPQSKRIWEGETPHHEDWLLYPSFSPDGHKVGFYYKNRILILDATSPEKDQKIVELPRPLPLAEVRSKKGHRKGSTPNISCPILGFAIGSGVERVAFAVREDFKFEPRPPTSLVIRLTAEDREPQMCFTPNDTHLFCVSRTSKYLKVLCYGISVDGKLDKKPRMIHINANGVYYSLPPQIIDYCKDMCMVLDVRVPSSGKSDFMNKIGNKLSSRQWVAMSTSGVRHNITPIEFSDSDELVVCQNMLLQIRSEGIIRVPTHHSIGYAQFYRRRRDDRVLAFRKNDAESGSVILVNSQQIGFYSVNATISGEMYLRRIDQLTDQEIN